MAETEKDKTSGEKKMEKYIQELVRNKEFRRHIKRLKRFDEEFVGNYENWTYQQRKKHDEVNKELSEIIDGYEKLRKRSKKLFLDGRFRAKLGIAEKFLLDGHQIEYAKKLIEKDSRVDKRKDLLWLELGLCRMDDTYFEAIHPFNKGEEIIHINPLRKMLLSAYPAAILIHPMAAKRDVLNYIDKNWKMIEYNLLRNYSDRKLKFRSRKYSQELLDIIWEHRYLPPTKIVAILDEKFPQHGLVYFEVSKLIQLEKKKRLGKLS